MEITARELAKLIQGTVEGNPDVIINNFAKIEEAKNGCITFLANPLYTHYIYTTDASAVLVKTDFVPEHNISATLIRVEDPYATLAMLLNYVANQQVRKHGIEQPEVVRVVEGVISLLEIGIIFLSLPKLINPNPGSVVHINEILVIKMYSRNQVFNHCFSNRIRQETYIFCLKIALYRILLDQLKVKRFSF